jgi:hypothetical protein
MYWTSLRGLLRVRIDGGGWLSARLAAAALGMLLCAPSADALLGLEVGVRGGGISYSGNVFGDSDRYRDDQLGSGAFGGLRLGVTTLPVADLVADLSYTSRSSHAVEIDANQALAYDFSDLGLEGSLRVAIFNPPLSPLSVYLGAGLGMHWWTDLPPNVQVSGGKLSTDTNSNAAASVLAGARFDPPALPFSLFAEGALGGIFGRGDAVRVTTVSVGLCAEIF